MLRDAYDPRVVLRALSEELATVGAEAGGLAAVEARVVPRLCAAFDSAGAVAVCLDAQDLWTYTHPRALGACALRADAAVIHRAGGGGAASGVQRGHQARGGHAHPVPAGV